MAQHSPSKIYLCARTKAKYDTAMKHVLETVPDASKFVHYLELDLQSFASIKRAANTFRAENERLDILMNNAGIFLPPPNTTADGYELRFGVNHMGHALFTKLLPPTLQKTASQPNSDVRIINVSSDGHKFALKPGFLPDQCTTDMAGYSTMARYGQSKLANILFTRELAWRYPAITSVALHPGTVDTSIAEVWKESHPWLGMIAGTLFTAIAATAVVGAYNQTWCATASVEGKPWTEGKGGGRSVKSGAYCTPVAKEGGETAMAKDEKLALELWAWTETELVSKGY